MLIRPIKILVLLGLCFMTSRAISGSVEIPNLSIGDAHQNIARVYKVFPLNEPRKESDTRVSLLVMDLGKSPSNTPQIALYLNFWKNGQKGNSGSSFYIDSVFQLLDFYAQKKQVLQLDTISIGNNGKKYSKKLQINYSKFLDNFERQSRHSDKELDVQWVLGTFTLTEL